METRGRAQGSSGIFGVFGGLGAEGFAPVLRLRSGAPASLPGATEIRNP